LLQDHSYQLVLVDLSLAFGFQPAHSFVMLPEADRWQREVAVGNGPVVTLLGSGAIPDKWMFVLAK